jgi:RNA polymerase sigma-70 factor, ECF subfamily
MNPAPGRQPETDPAVSCSDSSTSGTSLGLLHQVQSDDAVAWKRLVALYDPLVRYWCLQAGLSEHPAADARQEVFLAVSKYIGEFDRTGPGSFRCWLRTITRTKVADHFRKREAESDPIGGTDAYTRLVELPAASDESTAASLSEERQILYRQAMQLIESHFEQRTWRAFWRTVIEEANTAEVAAELDMTTNAVHLAKARVLNRLREEFAALIDD